MNKSISDEIGFKVKAIREKMGIKQEDLALQIGISQATLSKIENGEIELTLKRVEGICNALRIDTLEFLAKDSKSMVTNIFNNHEKVEANVLNGNKVQNIYQLSKDDLMNFMTDFFNQVKMKVLLKNSSYQL